MIKTTDYETSKRLTDALIGAGYKQEKYRSITDYYCDNGKAVAVLLNNNKRYNIKAYTMGELWQMLPSCIGDFDLILNKNNKSTATASYVYHSDGVDYTDMTSQSANPCNALAELVIWCIQNGHELNCTRINTPTNQK